MRRNVMFVVLVVLLTLGSSYAFAGENGKAAGDKDQDRTRTRDCYLPDNVPQLLLAGENGTGAGDKDQAQDKDQDQDKDQAQDKDQSRDC